MHNLFIKSAKRKDVVIFCAQHKNTRFYMGFKSRGDSFKSSQVVCITCYIVGKDTLSIKKGFLNWDEKKDTKEEVENGKFRASPTRHTCMIIS